MKNRTTNGVASPGLSDQRPEQDVVRAARLQDHQHRDEDQGQHIAAPRPRYVRFCASSLKTSHMYTFVIVAPEPAEPAPRSAAAPSSLRRSSLSLRRADAACHATASCSVMSRKSSSSVATRGVSAEMPMPAWPSAMRCGATRSPPALPGNESSPCSTRGPSIPCASSSARGRVRGLLVQQQVATPPALSSSPSKPPFVDDLPFADDRDAVTQFFDFSASTWLDEQDRDALRGEPLHELPPVSRMPAGSRPVVGSSSSRSFGSRRRDAAMPQPLPHSV